MEAISNFFRSFGVFHANAFYAILYFFKHNIFFIFVLFAIGYLAFLELKEDNFKYIDDNRRMI